MKFATLVLAAVLPTPSQAQSSHRLDFPCGRGADSDSVLMCGQTACAERLTIARRVTGGGPPRTEQTRSNSLFNVYETNGPDLTIDMCMAKMGLVHSSSPHSLATSCGSNSPGEWSCGSDFSTSQCEFKENQFDTSWNCGDLCPVECGCTETNNDVTTGHRVLLRYDTSVVNVGDTPWILGSRSKTTLSADDKKYRNYLQFKDDPSNCHGHVHLMNFARARVCADPECTTVVAAGEKVSFCVAETYSYGPESGWPCSGPGGGQQFSCGTGSVQGLSPGCADLYATYTDGNWIDVTNVPRVNLLQSDGKYWLELVAGAGCRNKDFETCSKCTGGTHINNQDLCQDETGCVWNNGCEAADWCCMTEELPDIWETPQDSTNGRCGDDPKCYLFPEPALSLYDNNVGVVPIELIPFGTDADGIREHAHPCNCDLLPGPDVVEFCGDGLCNTTECDASFDETSLLYCPEDCCGINSGCHKGCPSEILGPSGEVFEGYCSDGIDNDGDGLFDCLDPDCYTYNEKFACATNPCADGVDNDGDGDVDCEDVDCQTDEACSTNCINDSDSCTPGTDDTCCNQDQGSTCVCANALKQKGCKCQNSNA